MFVTELCEGARAGKAMVNRNRKSRNGGKRKLPMSKLNVSNDKGKRAYNEHNTISLSLLVSKLPDSEKEEVEKRPCIGLCYYLKLQGIVFDKYKAKMKSREERKPCIGMCFREKKRKSRARKQKKTDEKKKNAEKLM